jgi:hypothetical protein
MAYGHAERTLAAIRRLETETRELLLGRTSLDPEQEQWLREMPDISPIPLPRHRADDTLRLSLAGSGR